MSHLTMFEFGGHANLAGLSLLDIRASLDSPIYFPEWPTIEICCIFVPKSVQICLQSSKIRPPNSNIDKCVGQGNGQMAPLSDVNGVRRSKALLTNTPIIVLCF